MCPRMCLHRLILHTAARLLLLQTVNAASTHSQSCAVCSVSRQTDLGSVVHQQRAGIQGAWSVSQYGALCHAWKIKINQTALCKSRPSVCLEAVCPKRSRTTIRKMSRMEVHLRTNRSYKSSENITKSVYIYIYFCLIAALSQVWDQLGFTCFSTLIAPFKDMNPTTACKMVEPQQVASEQGTLPPAAAVDCKHYTHRSKMSLF